jgi:hypothetical protein
MSVPLLEPAVKKITSVLRDRGEKEITGAMLGELVRKTVPELSIREIVGIPTGPGALSRFAGDYLSHVLVRGRTQGSDPVYKILEAQSEDAAINPEIWQAFVRVQSPRILVLRKNPLGLEVIYAADFSPGVDCSEIKKATNQELDEIRNLFTDSLHKTLPESAASLPQRDQRYLDWSALLRQLGREHFRSWSDFRVEKIIELFESRLVGLGVAPDDRSRLKYEMQCSQAAGRAATFNDKNHRPGPVLHTELAAAAPEAGDSSLRAAIVAVIPLLSTADLRELKLPAGILMDALLNISKK